MSENPYKRIHNDTVESARWSAWNKGYKAGKKDGREEAIDDAIDVTGFTATLEALRKKVEE